MSNHHGAELAEPVSIMPAQWPLSELRPLFDLNLQAGKCIYSTFGTLIYVDKSRFRSSRTRKYILVKFLLRYSPTNYSSSGRMCKINVRSCGCAISSITILGCSHHSCICRLIMKSLLSHKNFHHRTAVRQCLRLNGRFGDSRHTRRLGFMAKLTPCTNITDTNTPKMGDNYSLFCPRWIHLILIIAATFHQPYFPLP